MSYYQDGYDEGFADGSAGDSSRVDWGTHLLDFLNTESVTEWEEGYEDGYEAGKEEAEND